ncbi:hypothetical protein Q31a_55350 [Aureliella helgolandensis]|uniref:Uncharacterized protein n=1 Tax=Aureliella helgolandensis TaxID=2527968 RepID=A0A518GF20_9BACT|nr:hypothetical protein Q31a_55350 [Aureliella helgolandensis]
MYSPFNKKSDAGGPRSSASVEWGGGGLQALWLCPGATALQALSLLESLTVDMVPSESSAFPGRARERGSIVKVQAAVPTRLAVPVLGQRCSGLIATPGWGTIQG